VKKIQKGEKGEKIKMTKKQIGVKKATKKNQKARNQKKENNQNQNQNQNENILKKISEQITKKLKIETAPKHIEEIISAVKTTDNFWQVVSISQKPIPVVAEATKILKDAGFIKFEDGKIKTTEKIDQDFKYIPPFPSNLICSSCEGRGVNIKNTGIYEKFYEIQKTRPKPIQKYDQGNITPESTVARIALMLKRGDVSNKKIIVLGDDDLVGIALGLTGLPADVLVLDIDERLIDFTNRVAKENNLKVRAEVFDLRKPLPKEFKSKFDVFVTDPPEAKKAFKTFLQKGIWTLKDKGSAGYIGMTLIDSSLAKWRELQKIIIDSGATITDIIRSFNKYETWDYHENTVAWKIAPVKSPQDNIWYSSCMVRIEMVKPPKSQNLVLKDKDIYVDTESTTT
jgi:predicted methyltransferase